MSLARMQAELSGVIPNLSEVYARTCIQRAWRDVCQSRNWSFKQQVGYLSTPLLIATGAVAVTQFSQYVVADATAIAALTPAVNAHPPLVGRQFRVGTTPNGTIYTITDFDSTTGRITLNDLYRGATNPVSTYQIYQCYYGPPLTLAQDQLLVVGPPVHRFVSIMDPNQGYVFARYHVDKATMDYTDPTRSSQGQPIWCVDFARSADGGTLYELWPHPIMGQTLCVTYQTLYTTLSQPDDEIPDIVPESLVVDRAKISYGYVWAMANAARFPQLKGVNWAVLINQGRQQYERDLARAKMEDDGRMLKSKITKRSGRSPFPLSASYLQSHDIGRFGWGG